jgi:lipoprotein-anchoring transpeptidase ErfK/SrfK
LGARLGGLTSQPARSVIQARFARPLVVVYGGHSHVLSPARFEARPAVEAAVRSALSATPRSRIALPVAFSRHAIAAFVDRLARQIYRAPRDAAIVGATASGPTFTKDRRGTALDRPALRRAIARTLTTGSRSAIAVVTRPVAPKRTIAGYGPVVVIDRYANSLTLYGATQPVRSFHVATGRAQYPTPSGMFDIVDMEYNPWWRPPSSDWATGLKPIPPGPGNPLGTRWMGLSASGVGIHGTPDDASVGYSRSHGCIRMHIWEAEWLFQHVRVGTPVVIL